MSDANIVASGVDRYHRAECRQVAQQIGLSERLFHARGTGKGQHADGSTDVRNFQRAVVRGEIKHKRSLLATKSLAEATCLIDERGNPSLNRRHSKARTDYVQAAVIAVSLANLEPVVEREMTLIQMPVIDV